MGAEASKMVDDSVPPTTLEKRSIDGIVKYIREKKNCKIVVMVGLQRCYRRDNRH